MRQLQLDYRGDKMNESVNSGVILSLLGKLSKSFQKSVMNLVDKGLNVDEVKESSDGGIIFRAVSGKGTMIKVKGIPSAGNKKLFDIYIKSKDGKKQKYLGVKPEDIDNKITEFFDKEYGETLEYGYQDAKEDKEEHGETQDIDTSDFEDTNSSKKLLVKLKKSISASETLVDLVAVTANYNACEAMNDLNQVVCNDAFVATIPNEATCFEIVPDETGYEVNPCEEFKCEDPFSFILKAGFSAMLKLQMLHWNIKGINFREVHNMIGDFVYKISYQLDSISEIAMQTRDLSPNVIELLQGETYNNTIPSSEVAAVECARQIIMDFVDTMNLYYPNFDHDVQSVLDNYIADWKSEAQYKLRAMSFPIGLSG